jgi:hypothetical protein
LRRRQAGGAAGRVNSVQSRFALRSVIANALFNRLAGELLNKDVKVKIFLLEDGADVSKEKLIDGIVEGHMSDLAKF